MQNAPFDQTQYATHQLLGYNPPADNNWVPVFTDEWLIVVNKPPGLLTVPGRGALVQDCLIKRVQARYPSALIVHRLDMDTSGLVLLALDAQMQRSLSGLFMRRQVDKQYEALVHGHLVPDTGLVDLPLSTDWPRRPRQIIDLLSGKPSQTKFQVIPDKNLSSSQTRLLLIPLTGRSHQLRVHCQALGHPIVGDPLYGLADDGPIPGLHETSPSRLMLHATKLSFDHPITGEWLRFFSPCPF